MFDLQKNRFENSNLIQQKNKYLIQDGISLSQLNNLFIQPDFFPHSKFSLSYTNVLHILNDVLINQKKSLIEFGSGYSTIMLSKLIKQKNLDIQVLSIDANEKWVAFLRNEIKKDGTEDRINIVSSELKYSDVCYNKDHMWHNLDIIKNYLPNTVDIIIVDGPEAGKEYLSLSRYPAIPFLNKIMTETCSIYLDDVNRNGEKQIILEWEQMLGIKFQFLNRYGYFNASNDFMSKPF